MYVYCTKYVCLYYIRDISGHNSPYYYQWGLELGIEKLIISFYFSVVEDPHNNKNKLMFWNLIIKWYLVPDGDIVRTKYLCLAIGIQ
jgi:hypothetical protein